MIQQDLHAILKDHWGYDTFRPMQLDIIRSLLSGRDTLAVMPTGGGKSLCFQVPAMAQEGLCLVVSPLIALMKDQVENLRKKGITAFSISSGMSRKEVINTLKVAIDSNCKFLYVSPERLETKLFKEYLPALDISMIAVDEAHCISQWGYDFRPSYLRIAALREELRGVPVLALTASATLPVQDDICKQLLFKSPAVFRQSFERSNLSYSVFKEDSKINKLVEVLEKVPGSSIVYCKSRKRTRQISDLLNMQGIAATYYHAGLPVDERSKKQEDWVRNKIRTIVCTNAFGMGIDKPDVRVVVHADLPDCLENYYQEAGRAGRDGKKAYAVLLFDHNEQEELKGLPEKRFPSLKEIRQVYQAVMNYLQVPSGLGEGQYFDFDLQDLLQRFQLDTHLCLHALKAMEQEGWLSFNEQVFLPSRAGFTVNKEGLYQFEHSHPELEPVIKALLRGYEGIFDQPVNIYEKQVAWLAEISTDVLSQHLKKLQAYGIIEYYPQKDRPQLYFIQNRVRVEELKLDMVRYEQRKKDLEKRIDTLIKYTEAEGCRSLFIAQYFGDTEAKACGICDRCLKQKAGKLTNEEFDHIYRSILATTEKGAVSPDQLLKALGNINKDKFWKVIHFLQSEEKISVTDNGDISLINLR